MKKQMMAMVLCVCLLAMTFSTALADTATGSQLYNWYSADLNKYTNTIMVRDSSRGNYYLVDRNGVKISEEYSDMSQRYSVYRVSNEKGVGMIDGATGQVLVPCEYDYADTVYYRNADWLVGYRLSTTGTAESNDFYSTNYSTGEKTYFMIEETDFYFKGVKVGTLPRTEYNSSSNVTVHGDYMFIKPASDKGYTAYAPDFTSRETDDGYSSEFSSANVHQGTGQQAFTASCTLTADEVENSVLENNNFFYDLQGNLLFVAQNPYNYASIHDKNYIRVRMNGMYGVIDLQGNEVIPPECDEINYDDVYFASGYQAVSVDGKLGFYNANGEVTCPFVYAYSAANVRGAFAYLQDVMGGYIVISAAMGELPMHYEDVDFDMDSIATCFVAKDSNDFVGVVDLYGNVIVPFDGTFTKYTWNLEVSQDGTLILGKNISNQYVVYQVEKSALASGAEAPAETPAETPVEDGSWTCPTCGEAATTNFCPNDGTAKPEPVVDEGWVCSTCGETVTSNFCPNDGTARP